MKRLKVLIHTMSPCFRLALCTAFGLWALSSTPVRAAMPDADFVQMCEESTAEQVKKALAEGANPNAHASREQEDDLTALMAAARGDNLPVVRVLLEAGADAHAKSGEFGTTVLMNAAQSGGEAVVRTLLKAGADVNARDGQNGSTALMLAAAHNNPAVIRALLEAGADVNAITDEGGTALMNAANVNPDPGVIKVLVNAGAKVNAQSTGQWTAGWTALMFAAESNRFEAMAALLEMGADKSLTDRDGHDALWHARHGAESDCCSIEDPEARKAKDAKIAALLQGNATKPLPTLTVYVSDPSGSPTNVRSAPGGAMAGTLAADGEYIVRLSRCEKGWCRAIAIDTVDQGPVQIQNPGGELWLHTSVLAFSTRNYGGQTLALRPAPDKQAAPLFSFTDEQTLRPLDFRAADETLWVQAETSDKKHQGWLEAEWVCGNPVTTCP